jgi:hypothetical protein
MVDAKFLAQKIAKNCTLQQTFGTTSDSRLYMLYFPTRATQSYLFCELAVTALAKAAENSRTSSDGFGLPIAQPVTHFVPTVIFFTQALTFLISRMAP